MNPRSDDISLNPVQMIYDLAQNGRSQIGKVIHATGNGAKKVWEISKGLFG
jgi:hypothetical protein